MRRALPNLLPWLILVGASTATFFFTQSREHAGTGWSWNSPSGHFWIVSAAALFFQISALSLLRGTRQALIPYLAAFVATAVLWWFVCQAPKHGMTFAMAGRECELGWWAGLVVLGLLVAITDRRKRYRPDTD